MMDRTDLGILQCLKENARMNASEISERVNLSVSAVIERIRKLEASGAILRYTVVLDPQKVGKDVCAFISVSLEHPKHNQSFVAAVGANDEIVECSYVTGDFDFLLKVMTGSTEQLAALLGSIKSIRGVSLTRTLVVLSTTKNEYAVLPKIETK